MKKTVMLLCSIILLSSCGSDEQEKEKPDLSEVARNTRDTLKTIQDTKAEQLEDAEKALGPLRKAPSKNNR